MPRSANRTSVVVHEAAPKHEPILRTFIITLLLLASAGSKAQSLGTTLVSCGGDHSGLPGGASISWSIGEVVAGNGSVTGGQVTQGMQQPSRIAVRLSVAALLEGPYNAVTGQMNDALRSGGWLPLSEPYGALGYTHVGGGGEVTTGAVLAVTGVNAIVDWVFLELRSGANNSVVSATRSALLQRDGDIVDTDGVSPVHFNAPPGAYYIGLKHRNHLSVLTLSTVVLGGTAVGVNLRDGSTPTYGTNALKTINSDRVLWAGDVRGNGDVKYTGGNNDRDAILVKVGGVTPTNTATGYWREDVNLDAVVKYTGGANDRDPILVNVGSLTPNNVRVQQLP